VITVTIRQGVNPLPYEARRVIDNDEVGSMENKQERFF